MTSVMARRSIALRTQSSAGPPPEPEQWQKEKMRKIFDNMVATDAFYERADDCDVLWVGGVMRSNYNELAKQAEAILKREVYVRRAGDLPEGHRFPRIYPVW
eukprot:TRINITY_DN868_c0_g3_i1.p3 TRINITY_DN868_c0_g3~~TRINITY_DN868_c0_g3_i1.p3  ORF type:complete len:102 (+),score=10.47 TRINITY_DN868_c0_g3_i1:147-452(+)